jgi:hypothetical protein
VTGTNNENYIFGYLGDYLSYNLPNSEAIYRSFLQGVSSYYGGYAMSYDDMAELKKQFRSAFEENPEMNFLEEFTKGRNSSVNRHFSYYVMSAFLYKEALNAMGFDEALSLVYTGSGGEDLFETLEEVLSIDEAGFHDTILSIISKG